MLSSFSHTRPATLPASRHLLSRPLRIEFLGALWHLTNRGVNRQDIFFCDDDRRLFLALLADLVECLGWIVHARVQMTNHYHLLVQTPLTNLSRGMKDLDGIYAQTINRRRGRVGHLFQGRFKGVLVERETHLLEVLRYVVLNPVRARMVESAGAWEWSSYRATAGLVPAPSWLETDWTLNQFNPIDRVAAHSRYRQFVAEGAKQTRSIWEDLQSGLYLGSEAFGARLEKMIENKRNDPEYPRRHRQPWKPDLQMLIRTFDEIVGTPLRTRSDQTIEERKIFSWLARHRCGAPVAAIAPLLGVTPSGASKLIAAGRGLASTRRDLIEEINAHLEAVRPETGARTAKRD